MSKIVEISVKTINGQILEFPKIISARKSQMLPFGEDLVRNFDVNECIVVTKLFLFTHGLDLFGTTEFSTLEGFYQFINKKCYLTIGGCYITINGKRIAV